MSANRDNVHFARASAFARETEKFESSDRKINWSDIQNVGVEKLAVIER